MSPKPNEKDKQKEHWSLPIHRAGVPLVAVETADPATTMAETVAALLAANGTEYTIVEQDSVRGAQPYGEPPNLRGAAWLIATSDTPDISPDEKPGSIIQRGRAVGEGYTNPAGFVDVLRKKGVENMVVFLHLAHKFLDDVQMLQAVWNLRDSFKSKGSVLVLLTSSVRLPDELKNDVVVISEPLPNAEQVADIVDGIAKDNAIGKIDGKDKLVDTMLGMSAFAVEQIFAMSVLPDKSIDRSGLRERKFKNIELTRGLSVYRGTQRFSELGGCANAKQHTMDVVNGREKTGCVVVLDEIDKALSAVNSDTSGTTQDAHRTLLTWMQDKRVNGMIAIGPPGGGKTAVAKAAAVEADIPCIEFDLGATKGSLVGQSEQAIRECIKVIEAISSGRPLVIATCNNLAVLPPEFRRRFKLGTMFFDLPTAEERKVIWRIYLKKFGLSSAQEIPNDDGWTGAEIETCCYGAWLKNKSLAESARFIVPVSRSAPEQIRRLRQEASGKFINASAPGVYVYEEPETSAGIPSRRKLR